MYHLSMQDWYEQTAPNQLHYFSKMLYRVMPDNRTVYASYVKGQGKAECALVMERKTFYFDTMENVSGHRDAVIIHYLDHFEGDAEIIACMHDAKWQEKVKERFHQIAEENYYYGTWS